MTITALFGAARLWLKANPWVGYLVAALAVVGAIALAIHIHTRNAIKAHDAATTAAVVQASTAADSAANASDAVRAVEQIQASEANQEAISHAVQAHPVEARAASGPAVNAVADRLRARQAKAHPATH